MITIAHKVIGAIKFMRTPVAWGYCKWCHTQTNWDQTESGRYICKTCRKCPNEQ